MKICVPVEKNDGMKSPVYGHFGSAPYFAIYDLDTKALAIVTNDHASHVHGACNPVGNLAGKSVSAVLCTGMGAGAIAKLNGAGIKTYRAKPGTLEDVVKEFVDSGLEEMSAKNACGGHGCH